MRSEKREHCASYLSAYLEREAPGHKAGEHW